MGKLVKSTRTLEEHVGNLMLVREAKDRGISDRQICTDLGISLTTLIGYKKLIAKKDLESLSDEYQNEKRCELDSQVQSVVRKLGETVTNMENDHVRITGEVERLITNGDFSDREKVNLKRLTKYPVETVTSIQKLVLEAIELRSKIWGLDKEGKNGTQIVNNKKIVLEVNQKIAGDVERINSIADSLIGEH